jgi:Kelch motif
VRRWTKVGAGLAIATLAAVTDGSPSRPAPPASPAGGGGTTVAPMPVDAFGGSAVNGGLVFGGYSFSTDQNLDTTSSYQWFGNHWTQRASMPDAHLMSSAVLAGNSIYVFGGAIRDPNTMPPPVDYCRRYEAGNDTWHTCPSLPDVRGFMASGYNPGNGKIYLAGGYNTATIDSAQTTTWEFDPAAGTYTQEADMPHGLGGAGSGFINGKLYVAGGRDAENTILDTLFIYDPATDTWSQGASMPQPENVPGGVECSAGR